MPPAGRRAHAFSLAKLSPPRHGRAFKRERLFSELERAADRPATWIFGPPGFGKTTLVATWLGAHEAGRVLWLQLDDADAQPATMINFVDQLSRRAAGRRWKLPAPTADDLRDPAALLRRRLGALAATVARPWILVLDNVQTLGRESPLLDGLAAALEDLPPQCRVIALSRNPPPAVFARAIAAQRLVVIDNASLRFSADETRQLIAMHGQKWDAKTLHAMTGGWAAAMTLLLAGGSGAGEFALSEDEGTRDHLFALFAGEVLAQLGEREAQTLMAVSFLPGASVAMAVEVSGDNGAGRLLADLAARSLFTERRTGGAPVYTFHALFSSFLQAHAAASLPADRVAHLRRHAADVLARHGQADVAIARLLEIGHAHDAASLLLEHAAGFVAQGRTASVREWLVALPAELRARQPWLLYWLGYCDLALRPGEALQSLEQAHQGFLRMGDARGSFQSAAAAADAIVFIGERLDTLDPWLAVLADGAAAYLAVRDVETDLRVLPGLLAAYVHRRTDDALTPALAERAEALLEQPIAAHQRLLLGTLAYFLLWTGQVARLDRIIVKLDRLCADPTVAPGTRFRWLSVVVLVHSLLGRIDEAIKASGQALALAQNQRPLLAKAHLLVVLACVAARDREGARRHLDEAAQWLDPANAIDATTWEFQRGMLALLDEDWSGALRLMNESVASGRASGWPLREHIALIGRAVACTEVGQLAEADAALREARAHPFQKAGIWHHWIEALVEANLADRQGDVARCLAALRQGLAIARAHGYDFGPLPYSCGDLMPRLMARALSHDIEPALCRRIVRRYALAAPAGAGEQWPWSLKIRTLGRFELVQDQAAATPSRKESRKPLELLKLTLALGVAASVDRLAAALWPDAEGDLARNSFDNALHRLRKLLGGDQHLMLRAGTLGINPGSCWTDLAALDALFVRAAAVADDGAELVAIAQQVLALYAGPLLPGDDGLQDVVAARGQLQARFVRELSAIGARLEALGQLEAALDVYRRAIEQDPLAEGLYRRLMSGLAALGRRAEAYEAYRRCRSQLSILLGVSPAPATEALAATLRDA